MNLNKEIKAQVHKNDVNVRLLKTTLDEFDIEAIGAPYPYMIFTDADVNDASDNRYYEERYFTSNGAVLRYVEQYDETEDGECVGDWLELMQLPEGFAIPTDIESLGSACIHTELPYLYIPGNIINIEPNAFEQCPNLKYIVIDDYEDKARFEEMLEGNYYNEYSDTELEVKVIK